MMNGNKEVIGAIVGTSVSATGTALQTNEVLSTISLIITIIGGLITIAMALINWFKKAKADGKITEDEIKEGLDIVEQGTKGIKDSLDDKKKGDKN